MGRDGGQETFLVWSEELRFVYGTQILTQMSCLSSSLLFFLAVAKIFNALSSWAEEKQEVTIVCLRLTLPERALLSSRRK